VGWRRRMSVGLEVREYERMAEKDSSVTCGVNGIEEEE
jgi:hypothetical protein